MAHRLQLPVKTPKLHFVDSGLLTAMRGYSVARMRKDRSLLGPLLESFVFSELLKAISWAETERKRPRRNWPRCRNCTGRLPVNLRFRSERHQRELLEEQLGGQLTGVRCRVVLRRDLHHIRTNDIETAKRPQQR